MAGERRWVFGGRHADEHPATASERPSIGTTGIGLDYIGVEFYIPASMRIQRIAATGYIRFGTISRPA
jgi:hypothetical protein